MDFSKEKSLNYLRAVAQLQFDELARLRAENDQLRGRLGEAAGVAEENAHLKELVAKQQHALFGKKTERQSRSTPKDKADRQPQTGHGPREQPELERVPVRHELPADQRVCPCCQGDLVELAGQVESSELVSVTESAYILEIHLQQKYRCACNGSIVTAPGPRRLVAGGRYSPSLVIEVAMAKYADHLPLERQAHIMKRDGLRVDSQTLWDQLDLLADYLQATYEAIIAEILTHPVIHADETRWQLMANGKTTENKRFQCWGLVAPELVAYRILDSRSAEAGKVVLGDYQGIVMADAYTVYQNLAAESGGFVVANCWAHVRRKFLDCKENFPTESLVAADFIKGMYAVEREATQDTRLALRQANTRPLVDQLMDWARATRPKVLPRSGIGEALGYLLNQEAGLRRFLGDARIPIDNNPCERALRGVVLGRKNHYGSRSRRGTEVAAILYTIMESAKLADVSPRAYLRAIVDLAMQDPRAVLTPASFKAGLAPAPA
ncbi:MAG: hypothetical protein JWM80_2619 [Cyanobacteria bacterium RYN_339]|nr:hypothetical protein [Cyanobacteria bacterium RYN_339]